EDHGVEIDELADAVAHGVGDTGDGVAAEAVADESDVVEILVFDHVGDVGHEEVEIDRLGNQVRALAEAGLRRRGHGVPASTLDRGDFAPAPAAVPRAVQKYVGLRCSRASDGWRGTASGCDCAGGKKRSTIHKLLLDPCGPWH